MQRPKRRICAVALFVLSCYLALCVLLSAQANASPQSVAPDSHSGSHLQPTPTPIPGAQWNTPSGGSVSDWDVYLTGSGISGIAPDESTIWAASDGGLLQWERATGSVTQYLAPRFPLPSNNLSQVLLHADRLYISGRGGLAVFDRGDKWTLYTSEDIGLELSYSAPMALVNDVLWIGAEDGIGHLFPDGHWEITYAGENTFPNNKIDRIVSREDGVYIRVRLGPTVQDEKQVMRFAEGVWEIMDRPLVAYSEAPDGSLWKGEDNTLFKSKDQGMTWLKVLQADRDIQPRAFDAQGKVYASKDDTIYVIEDDQIVELFRFTDVGPEVNHTNILEWDNAGRLWIATDGRGLTMFDGRRWQNWQDGMAGMRDDCIRGMAIGEHKLYAGTHGSAGTGGVNVFDFETEQWTNFWPGESELSGGGVDGIAIDSRGRVYFPTSAGVLDVVDGETWQHVAMPLPERTILSTSEGLFDRDKNYWVGTAGLGLGLWKYDGSEWTVYNIPGHINGLVLDQQNRLWLGTSDGLVVRDLDGNWLVYNSEQLPLGNDWIKDVAVDRDGRVWMIGYTSLIVFNGQEYQEFSPSLVGASAWGDAVTFDPQGNLWVEAGNGIATFTGESAIGPFTLLTLQPALTIADERIALDFETAKQREKPRTPIALLQLATLLRLAGLCIIPILCLLVLLAIGLCIYFVLRRSRTPSTNSPTEEPQTHAPQQAPKSNHADRGTDPR